MAMRKIRKIKEMRPKVSSHLNVAQDEGGAKLGRCSGEGEMEGPACQTGWLELSPLGGGTAKDMTKMPVPLCRREGVTGETMGFSEEAISYALAFAMLMITTAEEQGAGEGSLDHLHEAGGGSNTDITHGDDPVSFYPSTFPSTLEWQDTEKLQEEMPLLQPNSPLTAEVQM
ncbi:hypothetical protein GH733_008856 [Mirounga leonina]|nr:hypothetical protein GH733_008856 [Mirounga leonina]